MGLVAGARMVRQHALETAWTVTLLDVAPTDRVLELGCGAGRALELVARQATAGYVAGIDVSCTMVRAARRRNAQAVAAGRVAVLPGDATLLPFEDRRFDKILSIHSFYFWPDPLEPIKQCFRVLKPGGMLVLTLSTGRLGPTGEREFWPVQAVLEEQVIPGMRAIGFTTASLAPGPDNRQFNSVGVIGIKDEAVTGC
jgi:ubiquinone/menaquinone biosynthesis C-methylase UbiE